MVEIHDSFFSLLILCITLIIIIAMVLVYCNKKDKDIIIKSKAEVNKEGFSSELAIGIAESKSNDKKEIGQQLSKAPGHKNSKT